MERRCPRWVRDLGHRDGLGLELQGRLDGAALARWLSLRRLRDGECLHRRRLRLRLQARELLEVRVPILLDLLDLCLLDLDQACDVLQLLLLLSRFHFGFYLNFF